MQESADNAFGPLDELLERIIAARSARPATPVTLTRVHTPSGRVWTLLPAEWRVFRREVRRLRSDAAADALSRNRHGRRRAEAMRR